MNVTGVVRRGELQTRSRKQARRKCLLTDALRPYTQTDGQSENNASAGPSVGQAEAEKLARLGCLMLMTVFNHLAH